MRQRGVLGGDEVWAGMVGAAAVCPHPPSAAGSSCAAGAVGRAVLGTLAPQPRWQLQLLHPCP